MRKTLKAELTQYNSKYAVQIKNSAQLCDTYHASALLCGFKINNPFQSVHPVALPELLLIVLPFLIL